MTELRKTESELDEGLRLGPLLWPQKMAAELRRLHEENQALRTALAYTEQDLAYQEAKRLQALRTALAQPVPEPTQEIYAVLFAVEEAVRNGCAPWDIEAAFEKYEAKVKEIK